MKWFHIDKLIMASKDHKVSLKTVKKFENEFDCSFEYKLDKSKRWEKQIDIIK